MSLFDYLTKRLPPGLALRAEHVNRVFDSIAAAFAVLKSAAQVEADQDLRTTDSPNFANITRGGSQVYSRDNVVGTVSQTGGVPNGAIIERGSNASGEYVRYADGTQICWHVINLGSILTFGTGVLTDPYRSEVATWTYPADYVAAPIVTLGAHVNGSSGPLRACTISFGSKSASTVQNIQIARINSLNTDNAAVANLTAHGRWF